MTDSGTVTAPENPPPQVSSPQGDNDSKLGPPLSKNARKKLLKAERYAACKVERRTREKEKKRERAEKRRADDTRALDDADERRSKRRKVETAKLGPKNIFPARVVVDLAFDNLMTEKEVVSLCSQLAYTYSSNRKSRTPFKSLLFTSLNGKTLARLNTLGDHYKRWQHVEFWEDGYDKLWTERTSENNSEHACTRERVVYLTGDAEEELEELREDETYIIGGICDHNRYKNLCLNKAKEHLIRSARLPIGTFLEHLPTRKILTVNQVFDIILHWVEERDWAKALYAVMPKRKFQQGSQCNVGSSAKNGGETGEELNGNADANDDGDTEEMEEAGGV